MSFARSNTFEQRGYSIDFVAKKIKFEDVSVGFRISDFLCNILFLWMYGALGVLFFVIFYPRHLSLYVFVFIIINILYNTGYIFIRGKFWTDLQMFLESPLYLLFYRKQEKKIQVCNTEKIIFYGDFLWKFHLDLYGECSKQVKTIQSFSSSDKKRKGKNLIITFKRPVEGKLVIKYFGKIRRYRKR